MWPFLVEEERKHEAWIKQIIPKIGTGEIYFFLENFTVEAIETTLEYINEEYEKAEKEGIDLIRALSVAQSLEEATLDKSLFKYFDSGSPQIEEVLDSLREDSIKHRDLLENHRLTVMKEIGNNK